ncbi:MAG TPA: YihY/virulence factor BrkB family protein [Candidatus Acidoferrales bacterium]|jgi:membrane protein|nr:YihY/virulence factor BrkB family protein [Candidatus Acidoferrales bacterium]
MVPKKFKSLYRHIVQAIFIWNDANASAMGAAIAFYTIFAIAPLFILVLVLAGAIFGPEAAHRELFGQIKGLVGDNGATAIQSILTAADKPKTGLFATVLGFITLFVGASTVFIQLQQSLNAIWKVRLKTSGIKSFIRHRLLSFAALLGIGFLLLVSLIVSAALEAAGKWMGGMIPAHEIIWHILDVLISLGIITLLFAMMFKLLPDVLIAWRDVWVGSFVTALFFTAGKYLLGAYLGRSTLSSAYGAAGSFVVVLLWVYYSAQILLFGAASIRVYAREHGSGIKPAANAEIITCETEEPIRKPRASHTKK